MFAVIRLSKRCCYVELRTSRIAEARSKWFKISVDVAEASQKELRNLFIHWMVTSAFSPQTTIQAGHEQREKVGLNGE